MRHVSACAFALIALAACRPAEDDETIVLQTPEASDTTAAITYWDPGERLTAEDIERGRLETSWREAPSIDSLLALPRDTVPAPSVAPGSRPGSAATRAPILPESLDVDVRLPVRGDGAERSVLAVQVLLDRSRFSPGVLDGRWGKNTEKAVFWLQRTLGIDPTGVVDSLTFAHTYELAGRPARLLVSHRLTPDDVAGPFVEIPESVYQQARLECLCYGSLSEKLGERFHATPELLASLNPGVTLDSLAAGDSLVVPAIDDAPAGPSVPVARLVISDRGHYLHAVDSTGAILYHFPTTLGSEYDPSPTGAFAVRAVARDPWFHWQPELLGGVPDGMRQTRLPPGPNSPVGVVWIDLTVEHYGIHGTAEPAAIGYATSSGCVRLTNWDATLLAELVRPDMPVVFRDLEGALARAD